MAPDAPVTERYRQTRKKIYQHIYNTRDFCTRQSLARDLKLSLPTIYQHLSELMEGGLVGFSGEQRSTGGRNANGLAVIPDARFAIGASITNGRLRMVAADLRLGELAYRRIPYDLSGELALQNGRLAQELERFIREEDLDRTRLLGVGVALPGVLTRDASQVILSPPLALRNASMEGVLSRVPYPVCLENDATCAGYGEWFMREEQSNMVYLSFEGGVGGAVLVNGTGYTGDNRRSGEFGHMCVEPGGLLCKCGKQGCLEAYCSVRRISDDLGITLEEFFARIDRHDMTCETLWHDLLRHLAIGINNIRMALDCEVVLGGLLAEYLEPYFPLLKQYVAATNTFEDSSDYLHLSLLRKHTVPLGAAFLFIQQFLEEL